MQMFNDFFRGRNVLITGHTGFKGSWLTLWLHRLGANITGVSLGIVSEPNLFTQANIESLCEHHLCDIRNLAKLTEIVQASKPEIIFHLAALPLVRASYRKPVETLSTNIMGSVHLLEALRGVETVKSVVMVTSDKVYNIQGKIHPYCEEDRLGGYDPYSASKAASELVISCYRDSFLAEQGVALATARAGNVVGGGDWSEDRLIPDAVHAWKNQQSLEIRNPEAIRPWQHVLEPLFGYMKLAKELYYHPNLASSYNLGPSANDASTVEQVIRIAVKAYGTGEVIFNKNSGGLHEAEVLILNTDKSYRLLDIQPHWPLIETINRTMFWYRKQIQGENARLLCEKDILEYEDVLYKYHVHSIEDSCNSN